jgi:hypothetical protein
MGCFGPFGNSNLICGKLGSFPLFFSNHRQTKRVVINIVLNLFLTIPIVISPHSHFINIYQLFSCVNSIVELLTAGRSLFHQMKYIARR